jgi:uncharacterized protein YgbK (DUF1537 family)
LKLLIIADDLTGALDTGIQFSKRGIPVRVSMAEGLDLHQAGDDTEVMVVNTESRHISPADAYPIVYKIVKEAIDMGVESIYKKTDSTLRGNIGSELAAVMDAAGTQPMMFVPAYPEMNRTTENGFQYVDGVPLHQTAFATDILNPITESYIPGIIGQQSHITVKVVKSLDESCNFSQGENQIFLFDAITSKDMEQIGQFLRQNNHLRFTAGCAGFAEVLSKTIPFRTYPTSIPEFGAKALIVSGSLNERSMKQLLYGIERGYPAMTLTPQQKLERAYWHCCEGNAIIDEIKSAYLNHSLFIIRTARNKQDVEETDEYAKNEGLMETGNIPKRIAENTGVLVKKVLEAVDDLVFIVFGGDTAIGIIKAIEARSIVPKGEVQPGVAVSQILFGNRHLWMVTKAGGFGSDDVLGIIAGRLKEDKTIC